MLFAVTLPGLVVLLVVLAATEQVLARAGRRSVLTRHRRPDLSAAGMDVLAASMSPGKQHELDQRRVEELIRDDEATGARSRIDLAGNIATLVLRR
jgi:hypothetical protein